MGKSIIRVKPYIDQLGCRNIPERNQEHPGLHSPLGMIKMATNCSVAARRILCDDRKRIFVVTAVVGRLLEIGKKMAGASDMFNSS